MKFYQDLARIPVFTLLEASKIMGSKITAPKNLNAMIKEGSVHRIKRNLYTCVDFSTGNGYANRFEIASKVTEDSFVSFHSAFEFYGFYNQSYFDVQACSSKRFAEFEYDNYNYKSYLTTNLEQVDVIRGVRITSIERTMVDSINMIGKVMDAEELVKCLDLIHRIQEKSFSEC